MLTNRRVTMRALVAVSSVVGLGLPPLLLAAPVSAIAYRVTVTCKVPRISPERQLAPNWCLNYLPDGTQTFTAHVTNGEHHPLAGVTVIWSDSDNTDASFRLISNPCVTGSDGTCSAELADKSPYSGEKITVTATAGGTAAKGYLSFH